MPDAYDPALRSQASPTTAVLLINLGTPDAPTPAAVRRYLKEFLSDPRVVELPRLLWLPILHAIILNTRPKESAKRYQAIWTPEGSPLKAHTEKQAKLLKGFFGAAGQRIVVDYAMRYGQPSIPTALSRLHAQGCRRILLLPLYPQYANSTTATVFDAAAAWVERTPKPPQILRVERFADDPGYIAALAASVREHWRREGKPDESYCLVMSFHGVPRRTVERGDPYHRDCLHTGRLLAEALALPADKYRISFQSRLGRGEWLQPYTADILAELGQSAMRRIDVICPGFTGDCLETLEEIAIEGKAIFATAGGGKFCYIPCLNERDDWIRALTEISLAHLQE